MSKRIRRIEQSLDLILPTDYARFIEAVGYRVIGGIEVYGLLETMHHEDRIPCVIGATQRHRSEGLDRRFLVISHTGFEDRIMLLDTDSGAVFEEGKEGRQYVSASFGDWLNSLLERDEKIPE